MREGVGEGLRFWGVNGRVVGQGYIFKGFRGEHGRGGAKWGKKAKNHIIPFPTPLINRRQESSLILPLCLVPPLPLQYNAPLLCTYLSASIWRRKLWLTKQY
ncbi:MAG: hypothetical protein KDD89_03225, partial [Anaerolineales bacterium]|nr:hypothetical protein [Anaerolineales bacterium]